MESGGRLNVMCEEVVEEVQEKSGFKKENAVVVNKCQ